SVAQPDCSSARKKAWSKNGLAWLSLVATRPFHTLASIPDVASMISAVSVSANFRQEPLEHNLVGAAGGGPRGLRRRDGPRRHRHAARPHEAYHRQIDGDVAAGN